jgi:uncharacterized protein involved in outer membrane biogenesis
MRKLKWILGGLFAFVVALLVAGYVVIANYPVEDLKALIEEQALEVTGRKLEIRGAAEIEVSLSPSIVLEEVHFQNAPWAVGDDMVTMRRFEIEVEVWPLLSGEIRVKRFIMVDPVIALQRNAEGAGNWELGKAAEAQAAAQDGLTNLPSFEAVTFTNATVVFQDDAAGTRRTLALATLEASGRDLVSPIAVTAAGSLDSVPFDLAIGLGSVEQMASGAPFPLTLTGKLAGATLDLNGSLSTTGAGTALSGTLAGATLAELGVLAGVALPATGPYRVEFEVTQPEPARLEVASLAATVGGSDLAGTLSLRLDEERPRIAGELTSQHLSLADVIGADDAATYGGGQRLFSDEPLPIELLRALNASLTVTAAELVFGTSALSNVELSLRLENGLLEVTPFTLGYGPGTVTGGLTLDAGQEPPALAVQLQGSGLDLAVASGGAVTGSLAADLDLTGRGASPAAIAATLNGRSEFSSGDGRIDSNLLAVASSPLHGVLGPLFGGDSEVRLNCLVNRMSWKDGIGSNQGTAIDASTFSVIGNGTVNLRNETIDFYVDTWSKDTALVGLAVPVTVRGPLASPSIAPDPAGTALGLAKTAGLIVFPPAGLAAIISDRESAQEGNACVAVTQEVEAKGGPASFFEDLGGAAGDAVEGAGDALEDAGEAIGEGAEDAIEGIKSIFD